MLETWGPICPYTHHRIDHRSFDLDHIVPPKGFWTTDAELENTRAHFGLPAGWDPNGPENLIPVCRGANLDKLARPFSESNARYFLELAARHAPEVLRTERELREAKDHDRMLLKLHLVHSGDPATFDRLVSELENQIQAEPDDYESPSSIRLTRKYTELTANLPHIDRGGFLEISALFRLTRFTLSSALITLGQDRLCRDLLRGGGMPLEFGARRWVVGPHPDRSLIAIDIGNTRCFVQKQAAVELAECADRLADAVIQRSQAVEAIWGTLPFEPIGNHRYRLMRVDTWVWTLILAFAREHDFDRGTSEWHIFIAHNSARIMTTSGPHPGAGLAKRCVFWPGMESGFTSNLPSQDYLWLCWHRADFSWAETGNAPSAMNAAETFEWINARLIPAALDWANRQRAAVPTKPWYAFWRSTPESPGDPLPFPDLKPALGYQPFCRPSDLPDEVLESHFERLQQHFNAYTNDSVPTSFGELALDVIGQLATQHPDRVSASVVENLGFEPSDLFHSRLADRRLQIRARSFIDGGTVDLLLRSIGYLCGVFGSAGRLPPSEMRATLTTLAPLLEWHDREKYLERLAESE